MTEIFTFLVGQSCRSALNSWAAQQRRPTEDVKIFVLHPCIGAGEHAAQCKKRQPRRPNGRRKSRRPLHWLKLLAGLSADGYPRR